MLIDSHCHLDQLPDPERFARECESTGLRVIAVTNLPSHYAVGADRLRSYRYVTAALGLHPLAAELGQRELPAFRRLAHYVDWIGEIGLDFSRHGAKTREIQAKNFEEVLRVIAGRQRFVSLHSRGAEAEVVDALSRHGIKSAVFHWYTGSASQLVRIFDQGHYVSINPAMIATPSGQQVLSVAPRNRVLAETDSPHAKIGGRAARPGDVSLVYQQLASHWQVPSETVAAQLEANFAALTDGFGA